MGSNLYGAVSILFAFVTREEPRWHLKAGIPIVCLVVSKAKTTIVAWLIVKDDTIGGYRVQYGHYARGNLCKASVSNSYYFVSN